jgi:hypothetical protein
MPHQNRVTPLGEIIADPARGTVMGNRGNLHDTGNEILRPYQTTRWIICKLEFKDRRRPQMPPSAWTSLFFLDEATALAAGHRPCFECNREKARAFAEHWVAANPLHGTSEKAGSDLIDEQLQRERITEAYYLRDRRKRVYLDAIDGLPDGTFVALGPELAPFLVRGAHLLAWSSQGYRPPVARPAGITA